MHHSMLPLIVSCTRSWNFAWHPLWRSTTESKNIVKLLAISQTSHTVCCEEDYFPKGKFNYLIVCFTQCTLFFFQKIFFPVADLFALRYLWIVCNKDKCCVVTHAQRAADIRVAWLVYARTYCVPITTLNQITLFGRSPNNKVPSVVSKRGHTGHETKKHVLIARQTWRVLSPNIWSLTAVKANCRAKGKLFIRFLSARPLIFNFSQPSGIFLA